MMNMDFELIKKHHLDLMIQYGSTLEHVAKRESRFMLRMYVEDHIRMRLLELSKIYSTILLTQATTDIEITSWLRQTAENCENLAGKLITMREYFFPKIRFLYITLTILAGLIYYTAFGKELRVVEIQSTFQSLPSETKVLLLGWTGIVGVMIFFVSTHLIDGPYSDKRKLFGIPDRTLKEVLFNRTKVKDETITSLYSLENDLFFALGRDKIREYPITLFLYGSFLFFIVIFYFPIEELTRSDVSSNVILILFGIILLTASITSTFRENRKYPKSNK
jgi:hypothetical protein